MTSDNSALRLDCFKVRDGIGGLLFSERGLRSLILPLAKQSQVNAVVLNRFACRPRRDSSHHALHGSLLRYFEGDQVDFRALKIELDLEGFSEFEREVYAALQPVQFGQTLSYQQVAQAIGRPLAYRAVGNALAKNPIPIIIPCHRVLKCDRSLGGFSAGVSWKRKLLALEGVQI